MERTNRFYAVVTDGDGRVLVLDGSLPTWESPGPVSGHDAGPFNAAVGALIGAPTVALRPLPGGRDDDGRGVWTYELAVRGEPRNGRWVDAERVGALLDAEQRAIVGTWAAELGADDPRRTPWSRLEWYDEAFAWIDERLRSLGRERDGEPVQLHVWSISSVLRIPIARGDVYFKAVPPLFGHEPALTHALDRRHPGRVTTVLATDDERRWMLTEDIGGTTLGEVEDPAACEQAVRAYASLQVEWVDDTDALRALGCPDRTLAALEREIEETLADPLLVELPRGLAAEEVEALPALAERLRAACDRLRALDIPPSLEHGDLHPGNVRIRDGGPVFYDWTDGCVSVPLFSLLPFLQQAPAAAHERLRDAYLEPWTALTAADRLREAAETAGFLGLFHLAVSYRRIVHAIEERQRWEFGFAFPFYVRELLGQLR